MNLGASILLFLVGLALFRTSRRWAALPFLTGTIYIAIGTTIEIGNLSFTPIRILIALGFLRVLSKGERIRGGFGTIDRVILLWAAWAVISAFLHKDVIASVVTHLALVYNMLGCYFLLRIFIADLDDVYRVSMIVIYLLVPIAVEMLLEHRSGTNAFAALGGVPAESEVRHGSIRAQGPFYNSILAGTVGAVSWPFAVLVWQRNRKLALLGFASAAAMVVASASSGPIMSAAFIVFALFLWRFRGRMKFIRWAAFICILLLAAVMEAPVYYLISKIDLTGSSTGWHRSALIGAAIEHFNEWWLAGTDYTRHWMPTGVPWSENHTDITNHYIKMGVLGGFALMLLYMGILILAFRIVGRSIQLVYEFSNRIAFTFWVFGAILFGHAVTFLSVSYFDQTEVFVYLILATIASFPAISLGLRDGTDSQPVNLIG